MKYVNREMKVDQIIGYFNQHKINLIPPFQRGSVWNLSDRQKLLVNMVRARPIPAVFLYKEAAGPQFAYNILDGKQRLESLLLFVGDRRQDFKVENVRDYFFRNKAHKDVNFMINIKGNDVDFSNLDIDLVRAFREYAIPTIEIDLDDDSASLEEIVNLFIDINQTGKPVDRFDVVKALGKDPLFKQMFSLIAVEQVRHNSKFYRAKSGSIVFVMKRLSIVSRLEDNNSRIDRIWERLTEIGLFTRHGKHRAPATILRAFIREDKNSRERKLSKPELRRLRSAYDFLAGSYRRFPRLMDSRLATDQPQFYTLITSLLATDLMRRYKPNELGRRIAAVGDLLGGKAPVSPKLVRTIKEYGDVSAKQTTHPERRDTRQKLLIKMIDSV